MKSDLTKYGLESLDYNNQGMTIEDVTIEGEEFDVMVPLYDLSWFHVDGHDCGDESPSEYPIDLVEGVDCKSLWTDHGGTGLAYATCTEEQALAIIARLKGLGATDGVPAEV